MVLYTTAEAVAQELKATAGFTSSTTPSIDTVDRWIKEESAEIDHIAGRVFGETTRSETIDYNGEDIITLKYSPVTSVTSVLYSTSALGTATYALSDTKTADTDYTVYTDSGEIALLPSWKPLIGRKRIQVNYKSGYATIPAIVSKLASKKTAKRVIDAIMQQDVNEKKSGKSVSVGSISIVKPADFGVNQYKSLSTNIDELEDKLIGGFGMHRYSMRY